MADKKKLKRIAKWVAIILVAPIALYLANVILFIIASLLYVWLMPLFGY